MGNMDFVYGKMIAERRQEISGVGCYFIFTSDRCFIKMFHFGFKLFPEEGKVIFCVVFESKD